MSPVYMSKKDFDLFAYLNEKTPFKSGVLGGYMISSRIPAFTHDMVYLGTPSTYPGYEQQVDNMYSIYAGHAHKDQLYKFLKTENIIYIIWGPEEKNITTDYYHKKIRSLTDVYPKLKCIYQAGGTQLYAFQ